MDRLLGARSAATLAGIPAAGDVPPSRGASAWLMSLLLHLTLLVALGLFVRVEARGVAESEPERPGGIALVRHQAGEVEYFQEADASVEPAEGTQSADRDGLPAEVAGLAADLPQLPAVDPLAGVGQQLSAALPAAGQMTQGSATGGGRPGGRGQGQTQLFGATGEGNTFVYVVDRSGSMAGYQGRPMAAARQELLASIEALDSIHQFQIIFYNHQVQAFQPVPGQQPQMVFADGRGKALADRFVRGVAPAGGTEHMGALRAALALSPDVIFFLTDADEPELSAAELAEIRRRNARVGATIHAIQFSPGPWSGGENFLVRLARENDGQHVYVDVTRLPSVAR